MIVKSQILTSFVLLSYIIYILDINPKLIYLYDLLVVK